jgi:hypothetical protein
MAQPPPVVSGEPLLRVERSWKNERYAKGGEEGKAILQHGLENH